MARPLPRRTRDTAPDADEYDSKSKRSSRDEDEEDERRPRRSRGRGETPEQSRGRRAPAEPDDDRDTHTQEGTEIPTSKRALAKVTDDDFADLVGHFGLEDDATEDELWDAIEAANEEAPVRGRRGRASREEDEEPPTRGRRGRRSEPEEEEEESPRRGRGRRAAADEEEEDETPRRGRGRRAAADDEEDEKPARGRRRGPAKDDDEDEDSGRTARRGFEGFKKTREETSNFDDFKLTADQALGKFLEDEPYATYAEHGLYKELSSGQRVWICNKPDNCPICNTGHNARAIGLFNFLVMPEEGDPKVVSLKAGPALMEVLEQKGAMKTGPLSKEYYALSQTPGKNNGPVVYSVELVRERDLVDEWDETPFTAKELKEFRQDCLDESSVKYPSLKALKDVASELRNRD